MKIRGSLLFLLWFCLVFPARAHATFNYQIHVYPTGKIKESMTKNSYWGVALSGGGALGFAHLGGLKALFEEGLIPDMLSGTSMGAIIGGFLAAGYDIDEIIALIEQTDFFEMFLDVPDRSNVRMTQKEQYDVFMGRISFSSRGPQIPEGILPGYELQKLFLTRLSTVSAAEGLNDFNLLYYPFRAVSADLITGDGHIWQKGDLGLAVRSSMNIPGVFPPLKYQGTALVDGGIYHNLPVQELEELGADILIAFDFPPADEDLDSALSSLKKMASNLVESGEKEAKKRADYILTFPVEKFNSSHFNKAEELYDLGYKHAKRHLGEIRGKIGMSQVKYYVEKVRMDGREQFVGKYLAEEEIYRTCLEFLLPAQPWAFEAELDGHVLRITRYVPMKEIRISGPEGKVTYMTESLAEVRLLLKVIKNVEEKQGFYGVHIEGWDFDGGILTLNTSRLKIENIEIEGSRFVSVDKVRHIMGFSQGQFFGPDLLRGLDRLYSTGLFSILIPYLERDGEEVTLKLHVKERENNVISMTGNYRSDKGFMSYLRFDRNRIFRWGDFAGIDISISRDFSMSLFAGTTSFLKTPLAVTYSFSYEEGSYFPSVSYTEFLKAARLEISDNGYYLKRSAGLLYRSFNRYEDGEEEQQWLLEGAFRADTLNDLNLPTQGVFLKGLYEYSLNGSPYHKCQLQGEGYWEILPSNFSFYTVFFLGKISKEQGLNLKVRHENFFDHDRDARYNNISHIRIGGKAQGFSSWAVPFFSAGWVSRDGKKGQFYYRAGVEQRILLLKYFRWEYIWGEGEDTIEFSVGARIR